jgi:ketosteroid isomerase-like protein
MSQENVEAVRRALAAGKRCDIDALLEEIDPGIEWRSAFSVLIPSEATVFRGHDGVRAVFREGQELWSEVHYELSLIQAVHDRVVVVGRIRVRSRDTGTEAESLLGHVCKMGNGRVFRISSFVVPGEALEAAGLSE